MAHRRISRLEMFDFLDYLTIVVFLVGGLFVIDFHFVGFTPYLFWGHKLYDAKEDVVCSISSGKVVSNCFSKDSDFREIRGYFSQIDSKLAVTPTNLYIGKKLVSYHYKIVLSDVISAECAFRNWSMYRISIKVAREEGSCLIEIDGYAFSKSERNRCNSLVLAVNEFGDK